MRPEWLGSLRIPHGISLLLLLLLLAISPPTVTGAVTTFPSSDLGDVVDGEFHFAVTVSSNENLPDYYLSTVRLIVALNLTHPHPEALLVALFRPELSCGVYLGYYIKTNCSKFYVTNFTD